MVRCGPGLMIACVTCESQVCLLETSCGQVWAGSHDFYIYVIDNDDVISCTDTLMFAHTDKVVAMTIITSNRYTVDLMFIN